MANRNLGYSLDDDEIEGEAFGLWGGNLNSEEDKERWSNLSTKARIRWRNYVRDGIKPTRTGQHKPTRITSGKGRHRFTTENQPSADSKRGMLIKTKCLNCGQEITVWSCKVQATKWCKVCLIEILRLRARKWHRKNKPRIKNAKHPGQPIKPCVRLTEETIKRLGT